MAIKDETMKDWIHKLNNAYNSYWISGKGARITLLLLFLLYSFILFSFGCRRSESGLRQDQSKAIDDLIERQKSAYHIPGIAVAIIKNGLVIKKITLGFANVETGSPVLSNTSFQLSSTTKSFTSVAVMLLVSEGRLQLNNRVGDLLNGLPLTWQNVTVEQLLSHTSGLPDITLKTGELDLIADFWEPALKIIYNSPLQFSPGERWAYTQTNYVLLSMIIEKVSGLTFEKFIADKIFQPLEMQNSFFTVPGDSTTSIATNYEPMNKSKLKIRDLSFPTFVHAAGGLWSSLDDLIRWNASFDSGKLLKPELVNKMWSVSILKDGSRASINGNTIGYGLGWITDDTPGKRSVGHSGGNSTAYRRFVDEKFTIIVLHNGVLNPDDLVESIADIMRSKPGEEEPSAQVRLWEASMNGDTTEIARALKDKADIDSLDTRKNKSGRRALNWAAWFNHPDAVRMLLKNGAEINAQNATGFTALHHAAEAGSFQSAKILLEAGANTRLTNKSGNRPSETARSQNHPNVANLIDSINKTTN